MSKEEIRPRDDCTAQALGDIGFTRGNCRKRERKKKSHVSPLLCCFSWPWSACVSVLGPAVPPAPLLPPSDPPSPLSVTLTGRKSSVVCCSLVFWCGFLDVGEEGKREGDLIFHLPPLCLLCSLDLQERTERTETPGTGAGSGEVSPPFSTASFCLENI